MTTHRKCGGFHKPARAMRSRRAHTRVRDTRVMRLIMCIFTVVMFFAILFIFWCVLDLTMLAVIN